MKASPFLMECLSAGVSLEMLERVARGAIFLKESHSGTPFYARRAAEDPDYWNRFSMSRPNAYRDVPDEFSIRPAPEPAATSSRLTPSEIEALRRDLKETDEKYKDAFAYLRPKV